MTARILDGAGLAARVRERVAREAARFAERHGRPPGLAVVLVGDDPASRVYVGRKQTQAREAGFHSLVVRLDGETPPEQVEQKIAELARDESIDGLLVQMPVPPQLDPRRLQEAIPAASDVDGLHPTNAGRLALGRDDGLVPCTPRGCMALIDEAGVELAGAHAVVVGRSNIVGKPLAALLLARHATVTIAHSRTRDLAEVCRSADVLVACTGVPALIRARHVRPGAVVVDVGINRIADPDRARDLLAGQPRRLERFERRGWALVGDVHFGEVREIARAISPVPGGVGPMTVAMLLDNTLLAARRRVEAA